MRELIGSDLVTQRLAAMDVFAESLAGGSSKLGRWVTELDAAAAEAWLSAVNDARLILGELLGITDESDWEGGPTDDNPTSVVMYYLGWLEEELVAALRAGRCGGSLGTPLRGGGPCARPSG